MHKLILGGTVCAFSPVFVLSLVRSVGEESRIDTDSEKRNGGLPVNHVVRVKINQSLQCTMGYGSYFYFLEGFLVDWEKRDIRGYQAFFYVNN